MRAEDKEREDGDVPVVARCDQAWALLVPRCGLGGLDDELESVFHGESGREGQTSAGPK